MCPVHFCIIYPVSKYQTTSLWHILSNAYIYCESLKQRTWEEKKNEKVDGMSDKLQYLLFKTPPSDSPISAFPRASRYPSQPFCNLQ